MRIRLRTAAINFLICLLMLAIPTSAKAGEEIGSRGKQNRGRDRRMPEFFQTDIPHYPGNVILSRPTDHSITLSVQLRDAKKVRVAYSQSGKGLALKTDMFEIEAEQPREIVLDELEENTAYEYRIVNADTGEPLFPEQGDGSFRTCRKPGEPFTFTVTSDSHLDGNCQPELYKACLANVLADNPDLHIDLGDTFMTGKHGSRETAVRQYAAQRYYFGLIGFSAPIFLVIGNHDGEEVSKSDATGADGLAVWSCNQRKLLFPNPEPGEFYSGNTETHPYVGLLQDYYAWTWGDALFVVLDPYWTSRPTRGRKEPWDMTIGKTQYDWLARTLRTSKAKYKFVFIHQLTGGMDKSGRGGAEAATLYEWGGHELDGKDTFKANRTDWEKPIHSLLVENNVTIVFHGHDHFFARQELDGIIYQLVPQPSQRNARNDHAKEYGYNKGELFSSSGHLRVRVSSEQVDVDYIRAVIGQSMPQDGMVNGQSSFSYTCGTDPKKGR